MLLSLPSSCRNAAVMGGTRAALLACEEAAEWLLRMAPEENQLGSES